jgi:ATP:ADP antiporter, AAA family
MAKVKENVKKILSKLNIDKNERYPVMYLLIQAFLVGTFNGSFYIVAHSLFLKSPFFDKLPEAFIMSGVMALLLVLIFHILVSFFSFKKAKLLYSITLGIGVMALLTANYFVDINRYALYLFALVFPIQIASIQKFNATLNYYFPSRQSQGYFAIMHNSMEFGLIFIGYLIPIIVFTTNTVQGLLFLCVVVYLLMLVSEIIFVGKARHIPVASIKKPFHVRSIFSNRYASLLMLFLMLSATIGYLIHYVFIVISNNNFQSSFGLLKFFGVFLGTMYLFIFAADRFLLNRILNNLGMPYSMVLSPIATGVVIAIATFVGWQLGGETALSGYTFFFMFVAGAKYIENLFKYSVENPSANILLTTLRNIDLISLKEFMQGPVMAFSLFLAGLLIFIKSRFVEVNLLLILAFIAIVSIAWFWVSVKLIRRYRNNLKLRFAEIGEEKNIINHFALPGKNENLMFTHFQESNDEKSLYVLKLLRAIAPLSYPKHLLNYLNPYRKKEIIGFILDEIKKFNLVQALPILEGFAENKDVEFKKKLEETIGELWFDPQKTYTYNEMVDIVFSTNISGKKDILRMMGEMPDHEVDKLLPLFLKDIEPEIVDLALLQAKNLKVGNCTGIITEYLFNDLHYSLSYEVLVAYNDMALSSIEDIYYSEYISTQNLLRIIRLLGDIASKKAVPVLLDKLDENDMDLRKEVILSLRKHHFLAKEDDINIIMRHIIRVVENCLRNMAILWRVRDIGQNEELVDALNFEINENIVQIFGLLTLLYDSKKLNYIYDQIQKGNNEILAYAVEMLDFLLDEDLKNIIFPLFEDSAFLTKINHLQYYFPVELPKSKDCLRKVIHRENNLVSSWTKATAMYHYLADNRSLQPDDLISCMFHPIEIIRETAAYVLYTVSHEEYQSTLQRLPESIKTEMDLSIEYAKLSSDHLIYNRVNYIKKNIPFLQDLPQSLLVPFVSAFELSYLELDERLGLSDMDQLPLIWVFSGSLHVGTRLGQVIKINQGEICEIGGVTNIQSITAKTSSVVYTLKRNVLNELLFEQKDLLKAYLRYANQSKTFNEEYYSSNYERVMI